MSAIEKTVKLAELTQHPDNPRVISDKALEDLKDSLKGFPEMLEARPIVINKQNQVLAGNQRLTALLANGETETTVKVVDWNAKRQHEFMIRDNVSKGDWDYNKLLNEWETEDLSKWGVTTMTWNPTLDPDAEDSDITDDDVAKKQSELENRFTDADEKDKVTIICRNCGKEYYADKL